MMTKRKPVFKHFSKRRSNKNLVLLRKKNKSPRILRKLRR
jgi:hypothetical protein